MYKFTSPLTHKKLQQNRSGQFQSPEFDYSSLTTIDAKFDDFCKQSRRELFTEKSPTPSTKINIKAVSEQRERGGSNEGEILVNSEQKVGIMKRMLETYKNQRKSINNLGIVNPVVEMFGNAFIATFFQSLILKSVEDIFDLQLDDSLSFSNQVLENFGINHGQMKKLNTLEEKRDFILENMSCTIERLLKAWNERLESKERLHAEAESQYENLKRENRKECGDSFKWLMIKTKYQSLEKKLKTLLVQKLNDYENQVKILEMLKKRQIRRRSSLKIASTELKITLKNVNQPMTNEMLKNHVLEAQDVTSRRTISSPKAPRSLNQPPRAVISFNLARSRGQSVNNPAKKSEFSDWKMNQVEDPESEQINNFLTSEIYKKNLRDLREKDVFELTWDESLEEIFKMSKKTAKSLFIHEKNNGKWSKLAFKRIVQKVFTEEKKDKERGHLLNIYAEGGHLTGDEFRFLSDTSDLMNSCIDKRFFQKALNIIDPNILHFMEVNLAEQIIKQHKAMEEILILARKEFYKSKNELIVSKIAFNEAKAHKEITTQRNKEELLKKQKVFIYALNKIGKKEMERRAQKEKKLYKDINNFHTTFNDYEKEVNREINENSMKRLEIKRKLYEPKCQIGFENQNHPSVVKHRFHPSSKLFYFDKKEIEERKDVDFFIKSLKKSQEVYKVQITSPQVLRMPQSFRNFYSGGPISSSSEGFMDQSKGLPFRELSNREMRSILRIQARIRGFLERKRHQIRVEEKIKQNFVEMSDRVSLMRDLTLSQTAMDHSKTFANMSQSFMITSSNVKTHKKANSISTDFTANGRTSFQNYKFRPKSVKTDELFQVSKKLNSFWNNLSFCYSKKDINVHDNARNTPLYYAAKNGNTDFCEYLLENGGNPNEVCSFGETPLHMAMKTNKSELISLFLKFDPDFTVLSDKKQTPLDVCHERTLSVLNIRKLSVRRSTKNEGRATINFKESCLLTTEKSLMSSGSETKNKKTLSFRKKLVDVI